MSQLGRGDPLAGANASLLCDAPPLRPGRRSGVPAREGEKASREGEASAQEGEADSESRSLALCLALCGFGPARLLFGGPAGAGEAALSAEKLRRG